MEEAVRRPAEPWRQNPIINTHPAASDVAMMAIERSSNCHAVLNRRDDMSISEAIIEKSKVMGATRTMASIASRILLRRSVIKLKAYWARARTP